MEHMTLKAATSQVTDQGVFEAVISTESVDREKDIVSAVGMVAAIKRWNRPIPLAWNHSTKAEDIFGAIEPQTARVDKNEVVIQGRVDLESKVGREAWRSFKNRTVGFSFGYLAVSAKKRKGGGRHITEVDVFEVTATPTPMNNDTRVLQTKGVMEEVRERENLQPLQNLPRAVKPERGAQLGLDKKNWIEEQGGLPKYIKRISKHLIEKGMTESHAIATAVNAAKKMCASGDVNFPGVQQVNPKSRAEACAAVAEWEAMKVRAGLDKDKSLPTISPTHVDEHRHVYEIVTEGLEDDPPPVPNSPEQVSLPQPEPPPAPQVVVTDDSVEGQRRALELLRFSEGIEDQPRPSITSNEVREGMNLPPVEPEPEPDPEPEVDVPARTADGHREVFGMVTEGISAAPPPLQPEPAPQPPPPAAKPEPEVDVPDYAIDGHRDVYGMVTEGIGDGLPLRDEPEPEPDPEPEPEPQQGGWRSWAKPEPPPPPPEPDPEPDTPTRTVDGHREVFDMVTEGISAAPPAPKSEPDPEPEPEPQVDVPERSIEGHRQVYEMFTEGIDGELVPHVHAEPDPEPEPAPEPDPEPGPDVPERTVDGHREVMDIVTAGIEPEPAASVPKAIVDSGIPDDELAGAAERRLKAVWTAAAINDLPDSAFLYVASGGSKDADGKTAPRSLRYFPVKGSDGKVDLPHLRNALARIPQSNLPSEVKGRLTAKAKRMLDGDKSVGDQGRQRQGPRRGKSEAQDPPPHSDEHRHLYELVTEGIEPAPPPKKAAEPVELPPAGALRREFYDLMFQIALGSEEDTEDQSGWRI